MERREVVRGPSAAKIKGAASDSSSKVAELKNVNDAFKALLRETFTSPEDLELLGLAVTRPH
jgi:hypothetical protein